MTAAPAVRGARAAIAPEVRQLTQLLPPSA
jgi:hypothetical protein